MLGLPTPSSGSLLSTVTRIWCFARTVASSVILSVLQKCPGLRQLRVLVAFYCDYCVGSLLCEDSEAGECHHLCSWAVTQKDGV